MNETYLNAKYCFTLGDVSFNVELDDSLSAEYRTKKYPIQNKKTLHYHPLQEIFFVFEDNIKVTFENDIKEYENSIVSIPPNKKHFTQRSSDYRILFSCVAKKKTSDKFSIFYTNFFKRTDSYHIPVIDSDMKIYLEELCNLFYNNKFSVSEEIVVSILKLIFYKIYVHSVPFEKSSEYHEESRYIIISRIISECTTPSNDVTLSTIANALHLSEKQTSRMIYKYYECSLSEVIANEKADYAAYLLTTTEIPISEIAYRSNFHSENYFYNVFKKKFGVTPLKYRKQKSHN